MDFYHSALILSMLLCGLVAGLVFTFGIIVMPGIKTLPDRDYLRAFAVMDRIIQNNHPLFILVWLGSVLAIIALCYLTLTSDLHGDSLLVGTATAIYLLGVQLPTIVFNLPLNNRLTQIDWEQVSDEELQQLSHAFATQWVRSNHFRTLMSVVVMVLLAIQAIRL